VFYQEKAGLTGPQNLAVYTNNYHLTNISFQPVRTSGREITCYLSVSFMGGNTHHYYYVAVAFNRIAVVSSATATRSAALVTSWDSIPADTYGLFDGRDIFEMKM